MPGYLIAEGGRVRVMAELCDTCVFRPGNLMHLHSGRLRDMIDEATRNDSTIVCHQTLDHAKAAACRGFYDRHPTTPLQIAGRLELIDWHRIEE